jgi:hypothetical protein
MLTVELEPIIPASKWPQTHSDCMASGIRRGFSMGMYEGESKSKGKKTCNCFNRNNCEQFYILFFSIVPLQHNAFVISFNVCLL